jgi:hypothetical protein
MGKRIKGIYTPMGNGNVNELFEETGLPLLRVQSKGDYCAEELRDMIVREARRKRAGGSVLVKRA